ncbi:hypothetical protein ABZV75_14440 [Streptomyces flaveolus]
MGAITIVRVIGVYALVSGALVLAAARRLRGTATAGRPVRRTRHA